MFNIFLDDERFPHDVTWIELPLRKWDILRTQEAFEQFVLMYGLENIDHISFDNDLGDGMGEGIFCAQWMVNQVLDGKINWNPNFTYTIHSKNNVAAERIKGLLDPFIQFMKE